MPEVSYDPEQGSVVINHTDLGTDTVMSAFYAQQPEVAQLVRWTTQVQASSRQGTIFDRDRYVTPVNPFDQMRVAYDAAEQDDVVSGVIETTEALAFSRMSLEADHEDDEDIWNQIADSIELDVRLREMWREESIVSQFYAAVWWGRRSFKVSGRGDTGVKRKKTYDNLIVPVGMSILDPLKVIPVGNFLFGQEQLAYIADRAEADIIDATLYKAPPGDPGADLVVQQLIVGKYQPSDFERKQLVNFGGGRGLVPDYLYILNPANVFRHTATRSQYQRLATIRMRSIFELLDLKHQLKQMDRAHLIGGTNFIVLIKKGSEKQPGTPAEVTALKEEVKMVARTPVLVGDARLSVEIVTPKQDHTLEPSRYSGIDARILARLFGMLMAAGADSLKRDDSVKVAQVVARGIESRRDLLRKTINKKILQPIYDRNPQLTELPELTFHPKRIALDFDPALATLLFDLWSNGGISLESILEEVDYDIGHEATRRKAEEKDFKGVFVPTVLPAGSPGMGSGAAPADPKGAGRAGGGNRGKGGAAPGSGQGKPPVRPKIKGTP